MACVCVNLSVLTYIYVHNIPLGFRLYEVKYGVTDMIMMILMILKKMITSWRPLISLPLSRDY